MSEGVGIADVKWREVKDLVQLQTQQRQQHQEHSTGAALEEMAVVSPQNKDCASVWNSVVYGLPHIALNLPS